MPEKTTHCGAMRGGEFERETEKARGGGGATADGVVSIKRGVAEEEGEERREGRRGREEKEVGKAEGDKGPVQRLEE